MDRHLSGARDGEAEAALPPIATGQSRSVRDGAPVHLGGQGQPVGHGHEHSGTGHIHPARW